MDLEALRHGNFASLGTAIDDWSSVVKSLTTMEKRARKDLKVKADRASWAGVNATVSREFISKTAGEFTDAVTQATTIRDILRDTRDELVTYRGELNEAIDRGWDKHLTVVGTQGGGFKVFVNVHPEPANSKQAVDDLVEKLQGILSKATTSDSSAAEVLRAIAEQADFGFSGASYKDRDSAAEALKRADDMAKLAKDAKHMSPEELQEFNRTLAKYKNDELFAAQFATKLGAKETLQFWTDMSDVHAGAKGAELKELQELQKNLSMTLATATISDADRMTEWKTNVINEGNTSFRADPSNPLKGAVGALGFQVMSSLMSQGKYDAEFLDDYGTKLLKADMAPAGRPGMGTNELWKSSQITDLVFGKDDGRDPMVGFMKALSHSPEGATNIFDDKSVVEHVLESTKYTDRGASVGLALEAAVTGVGDGEKPTEPRPHSKAQVEIMRNVMHAVAQPGGGADLVKEGGLGESLGHMASAYMPEISREMAGRGTGSIFLTNSADPDGLDKTDTTRFLYEVSRDEKGKAAIIFGETIYTSSALEAHIADRSLFAGGDEDAIKTIAKNSGIIRGIVGHSVADAGISESLEAEKSNNDALKSQGDFYKAVLAAGIGVGTVALVPVGAGAAAAGATASGFFGGIGGMAIDRLMDGRQQDGALDDALYTSGRDLNKFEDAALQRAQGSARSAIDIHNSKLNESTVDIWINESLSAGWHDSDTILEDTHERPSA